jgi:hypothetical protein
MSGFQGRAWFPTIAPGLAPDQVLPGDGADAAHLRREVSEYFTSEIGDVRLSDQLSLFTETQNRPAVKFRCGTALTDNVTVCIVGVPPNHLII